MTGTVYPSIFIGLLGMWTRKIGEKIVKKDRIRNKTLNFKSII